MAEVCAATLRTANVQNCLLSAGFDGLIKAWQLNDQPLPGAVVKPQPEFVFDKDNPEGGGDQGAAQQQQGGGGFGGRQRRVRARVGRRTQRAVAAAAAALPCANRLKSAGAE